MLHFCTRKEGAGVNASDMSCEVLTNKLFPHLTWVLIHGDKATILIPWI